MREGKGKEMDKKGFEEGSKTYGEGMLQKDKKTVVTLGAHFLCLVVN